MTPAEVGRLNNEALLELIREGVGWLGKQAEVHRGHGRLGQAEKLDEYTAAINEYQRRLENGFEALKSDNRLYSELLGKKSEIIPGGAECKQASSATG